MNDSNNCSKLIGKYSKYALFVLIIASSIAIFGSWICYIIGMCNITYPVSTLIGGVLLVFMICINKKIHLSKVIYDCNINSCVYRSAQQNIKIIKILDISYIIGVIFLLILIQVTDVRPPTYFIIAAIISGIVAMSIFLDGAKKKYLQVIKITIFSIITTFSIYKYCYWIGNDGWFHTAVNNMVATGGVLSSSMGKELASPIQHIAIAITNLVTSTDIFTSSIITTGFVSILISVFVYCIAKQYLNEKFALISMLIFNVFAHTILWRILDIPTSEGVILSIIVVFLYFKLTNNNDNHHYFKILLVCFFLLLCYTHMFSTVIVYLLICGLYVASMFCYNKFITPHFRLYLLISVCMFIMLLLTGNFGLDKVVVSIQSHLFSIMDTTTIVPPTSNVADPSYLQLLLNTPDMIFLVLTIISLYIQIICCKLHLIRLSKMIQYTIIPFALGTCAFLFTGLTFTSMAHRFEPYLTIFMALIIPTIFIIMFHIFQKFQKTMVAVVVLFITILCMINLPYYGIAPENPLWVKGTSYDTQFMMTINDVVGVETILPLIGDASVVAGDVGITRPLEYYTYKVRSDTYQTLSVAILNDHITVADWLGYNLTSDYVIFRDFLLTTPTYRYIDTGSSSKFKQAIQLDPAYQVKLDSLPLFRMYDNGDVTWYLNR